MASKPTIQSGSKSFGTATNITIARGVDPGFDTAVDVTKTILIRGITGGGFQVIDNNIRSALTDGDTITFDRQGATTGQTIYWSLLTFDTGVTVQHVTASIVSGSTTASVAITGAGSGGRFVISGGNKTAGIFPSRYAVHWRIASDLQVEASCATSTAADVVDAACQVVEWDNATVQPIAITESWSGTTRDKTIAVVDATKTFVFGTTRLNSPSMGDSSCIFSLPNTTTLRLTRGGTNGTVYTGTIYVVSVESGVNVQYAPTTHVATTQVNYTLSSSVVLTDTVLNMGSSTNNWWLGAASEPQVGRLFGRPELTSTTNLRTHQSGNGTASFSTQVIEFTNPPSTVTNPARLSSGTNGSPLRLVTQQGVGSPIVVR